MADITQWNLTAIEEADFEPMRIEVENHINKPFKRSRPFAVICEPEQYKDLETITWHLAITETPGNLSERASRKYVEAIIDATTYLSELNARNYTLIREPRRMGPR